MALDLAIKKPIVSYIFIVSNKGKETSIKIFVDMDMVKSYKIYLIVVILLTNLRKNSSL